MDKKGAAHLEMIIAFVFFTGFVFFLFSTLKPTDSSTLSSSVLTGLHDSFEKRTYTNLSNMFLKVDSSGGADCFSIKILEEIFSYRIIEGKSHVTKLGGDDIDCGLMQTGSGGWKLNIGHEGETAFRIAFSPEFSDEDIDDEGCDDIERENCELGSVVERQVVSYSALEEMSGEYYSNYDSLKNELKIPPIFDFAIVTETSPEVNMEPELGIPSSVDIMVESYVFGVLKNDGTFINERFSFKIW